MWLQYTGKLEGVVIADLRSIDYIGWKLMETFSGRQLMNKYTAFYREKRKPFYTTVDGHMGALPICGLPYKMSYVCVTLNVYVLKY